MVDPVLEKEKVKKRKEKKRLKMELYLILDFIYRPLIYKIIPYLFVCFKGTIEPLPDKSNSY